MTSSWRAMRRIGIILAISTVPAFIAYARSRTRSPADPVSSVLEAASATETAPLGQHMEEAEGLFSATPVKGSRVRLAVGLKAIQGRRDEMEDTHVIHNLEGPRSLVAVFDGHAGRLCAEYAAQQLPHTLFSDPDFGSDVKGALRRAFLKVDSDFLNIARRQGLYDGCTALAAVIDLQEPALTLAWAGDSRAVLCRRGKALELSQDHKPDRPDEKERILRAGGRVHPMQWMGINQGPARVWPGGLAVSRALGDLGFKMNLQLVSAEPEITQVALDVHSDSCVILACDGLWDVVSSQEACDIASQYDNPQAASVALVKHAYQQGSTDNISVLVVKISEVPAQQP